MAQKAVKIHRISIRKGDTVHVMSGRDVGKSGRVLSVNPRKNTVIVEHAHLIKRHTRPNPARKSKFNVGLPGFLSRVCLRCPQRVNALDRLVCLYCQTKMGSRSSGKSMGDSRFDQSVEPRRYVRATAGGDRKAVFASSAYQMLGMPRDVGDTLVGL
jgi:ribosomal protein L24